MKRDVINKTVQGNYSFVLQDMSKIVFYEGKMIKCTLDFRGHILAHDLGSHIVSLPDPPKDLESHNKAFSKEKPLLLFCPKEKSLIIRLPYILTI